MLVWQAEGSYLKPGYWIALDHRCVWILFGAYHACFAWSSLMRRGMGTLLTSTGLLLILAVHATHLQVRACGVECQRHALHGGLAD